MIAEGVETEEQLAYLREKGCDIVQGFYFSEPLPAENLWNRLRKGGTPARRPGTRLERPPVRQPKTRPFALSRSGARPFR